MGGAWPRGVGLLSDLLDANGDLSVAQTRGLRGGWRLLEHRGPNRLLIVFVVKEILIDFCLILM